MADERSQQRPQQQAQPTEHDGRLDKEERGAVIKVVVGLALIVIFIVFIVQNADPVNVNFVFFTRSIRLIWVFLGCAVIGGVIAWLVGRPRRRAQKKLIEELERQRKQG